MIRFEHLSKTFQTKDGAFEALKDVSFEIEKGDIYGVIGYSGAGKSTLFRMVNALERPTSGKIFVEDKDIGSLSAKSFAASKGNRNDFPAVQPPGIQDNLRQRRDCPETKRHPKKTSKRV
ncbi:MAG: ATP-binding cassette domain-containing protein [Clostridium fessum]